MSLEKRTVFQNKFWTQKTSERFPFRREVFKNIWKNMNTGPISLIVGPRRVGKSVVLKQLIFDLINKKSVDPKQILFFEFSPEDKSSLIWEIYDYFIHEIANNQKQIYLFFDEIQYIDGYESKVKEIYDNTNNIKMFLTGSLSLSYKRKMEESLAGRFFSYRMYPLNFEEYLALTNLENLEFFKKAKKEKGKLLKIGYLEKLNPEFRKFLASGRLPEAVKYSKNLADQYYQNVVSQSLNQDVYSYFDIQKPKIINSLFKYFQCNNGVEISVDNISNKTGASRQTINQYIDILEQMNLVYIVYNTKNYLKTERVNKKVYVNSAFSLLELKHDLPVTMGFAVESYILERLLEKKEIITFWRNRKKEVDFLLPQKKIAYEIKFRNDFPKVKKHLKDHQLIVISLNQTYPACLF